MDKRNAAASGIAGLLLILAGLWGLLLVSCQPPESDPLPPPVVTSSP